MIVVDQRLSLPGGKLFLRRWIPDAPRIPLPPPGAPILLFHDSLGCVELWKEFPEILARTTHRDVVAYDRLGFGRSDPRSDRLTSVFIAEEAEQVVPRLREALAWETFVPCGHSVGGGIAVETAARWPAWCEALITVSAQAFVEDRTLEGIRRAAEFFRSPEGISRLRRHHGEKAEWVVDAWTETWLSPSFAGWSLDEARLGIRCPVLAIHGEDDEYGSSEHPRRIAAANGTARILPDTGHLPHRQDPAALARLIADFLTV